jgi:hypothetical protein
VGTGALNSNTGPYNTATGADSLYNNTGASRNTATGAYSLYNNTTGDNNTANGTDSLWLNTTGNNNTAAGADSLRANTIGNYNTAIGNESLSSNTAGNYNTAVGLLAGGSVSGDGNTAVGAQALENGGGSGNIAIGYGAGSNHSGGDGNNIDIGNAGNSGQNGTINIGTQGQQQQTFIAGIANVPVLGGVTVYVNPQGQLGVGSSSERFKTDIASMHLDLAKVLELRPVTFHYKNEPAGTLQYGLIAEEVAKVFPDLVIRDSKGTIMSVRYDELSSILLKELQTQQAAMTDQQKQIDALNERFAEMEKQNRELREAILRATKNLPPPTP